MLERIVGRVMGAEFGIEVAENSDPYGFTHRRHSKLRVRAWRYALGYGLEKPAAFMDCRVERRDYKSSICASRL